MIQFIQEAALPKLSQTSLYVQYDRTSHITEAVKEEFTNIKEHTIKSSDMQEIVSLMKLNGDAIIKKAINAWDNGDVVVIFNPTSKIPSVLPYIIAGKDTPKCYVFADKLMSKLTNTNEYVNLMAGLEAGYIALQMTKAPNRFTNNRDLVMAFCVVYQLMVTAPLENRLYMKGENLTKAMLYTVAYFYRIIDGENMSPERISYKRFTNQKIDPKTFAQIVEDVKALPDTNFLTFIELIKKLNPVRYKNLESMYLTYFVSTCSVYLVFALENPTYLPLLVTSANYKTKLTQFGLNKLVGVYAKKILAMLTSIV